MQLLKNIKLVLVSLCLIITAILIGGCKVDFEIKGTDPKEENYLTFTSGTKGYKMLFHKDAIVNKFYEIHDKNFESATVTFRFKNDNLLIYQDTTYYDSTDFGQDVEYLADSMEKNKRI